MRSILAIPMMTSAGPQEVYIDSQVAERLLPILEEFLETSHEVIDLVFCERCHTYAIIAHVDCEGIQ